MKKILFLLIFSFAYPLRWEFVEIVPKAGQIEIDTSGILHTVYRDRYEMPDSITWYPVLCHGMRKDTGWWYEGVDTLPTRGFGGCSSFKLGSGIYPYIAYSVWARERIQWGPKYLKYAAWDGKRWNIQVVDSVDRVQVGPAIPIFLRTDSKNYPHIVYMDRYRIYNPDSSWTTYVRVRYAKWDGDAWEFTTLDSTNSNWDNGFTGPSAMVLDNEGHPHIVGEYWHCTEWGTDCTTAVVHLYEDDTGWHTDTLCDTIVSDVTYYPYTEEVITLDPKGRPIIIFGDCPWYVGRIHTLWLARKEGDRWDFQAIDTNSLRSFHIAPTPRWDKKGRLHIAYKWWGCMIKYGVWDGDAWTIDTVYVVPDSIHSDVSLPHLALDSKGYPHLVFKQTGITDGCYYFRGLPEGGIEESKREVKHPELIIFPNPAKGMVNIRYEIPDKSPVELKIYDASGRLVRTLARAEGKKSGVYTIKWDGRDNKDKFLPSGVYWLILKQGNKRVIRQLIKIK